MTYTIEIVAAAELDARKAFLWYEEQKLGLGKSFESQFDQAKKSIQSNPHKTQIKYKTIRVFLMN